ncbi:Smr/MutS family protein [Nocardioides euryhalodurans]|uniref:Uncharacterized protein n=1 Tax=Nocardioides euryhalodurans TaxID=2518370 RepID=A0A4P7GPG4_9ACTN|nr:Smr/MutS family protein [Nocardioides euryhalodurans]QBR94125.1 hypothetical protein EXE57_18915 [Nocardioides euryhalodurans]
MTRPLPSRTSRRGALGGMLVGLTATGCDLGPVREEPAPTPGTTAEPEPAPDPDAALVDAVVADLRSALALVTGAGRGRGALRAELAPWLRMHDAHLVALEAPSARVRAAQVRGSAAEARSRVRREETALQRRLATGAASARSGALASLLATMSAAVAQQLAATSPGEAG